MPLGQETLRKYDLGTKPEVEDLSNSLPVMDVDTLENELL